MLGSRLLKPWYVYRPSQIGRRIYHALFRVDSGYRPLKTAWGGNVIADPSKTIGRSILTTGIYDLSVSECIVRLVRPGDLVVDGGANVGYMTTLSAFVAGSAGKILAFEPHPEIFSVLRKNIVALPAGTANVESINEALGAEIGIAKLILPEAMYQNDGIAYLSHEIVGDERHVPVAVTTIDAIVGERFVGVLKLDVEGFEMSVLRGARRALAEHRIRDIIFEDHRGAESEVCRTLSDAGYALFSLRRDLRSLLVESAELRKVHSKSDAPNFLATTDRDEALRRCAAPGWRALKRFVRPLS